MLKEISKFHNNCKKKLHFVIVVSNWSHELTLFNVMIWCSSCFALISADFLENLKIINILKNFGITLHAK